NGATIVVISHDDLLDARRLRTRLDACGVTLAFLTTALFDHLARHDPDMFGGLRTLAVGGEQMRPAGVRAVLQSATPPQRLVNVYRPTEATTFSCSRPVTHLAIDAVRVPIGHPLLQTELAVVDEHGARVPAGSTGELWIAGSGLACGYLGDAEATNHAFVDASLPGLLGSRWYRTGDLAVQRANGEFECLGRIDRQLKVNGHRIEPAEVERAIQTIDGVNAAAVVAQPKGTSTRLLGFVVADGSITASDISAGLAATLHAFMRPSRVLLVDSLPITANGKLDEAALLG
ncbi:MAG: AMP-binding protein, partial [Actinomycetota bacterium]